MPEQGTIGPETNLINKLRLHLSAYQAGRKFLGTVDEATKLTELLGLGDLGNVNAAGTVTPFSTFAKKSLDTEQGLTEFGKLSKKFVELLREHIEKGKFPTEEAKDIAKGVLERSGIVDYTNEAWIPKYDWSVLANVEDTSSDLYKIGNQYMDFLKTRKNLKNLNLPHPSLDFYKNVNPETGEIMKEAGKVIKIKPKE